MRGCCDWPARLVPVVVGVEHECMSVVEGASGCHERKVVPKKREVRIIDRMWFEDEE